MKHPVCAAVATLAAAALAGSAHAQPANPQLQGGVDLPVRVTIANGTPYSLFTQTLMAELECMDSVIPATSLPGWREQTFNMVAKATGGCFFKTSSGQQTFVLGADGAEHRINVPFVFSRDHSKISIGSGNDQKFKIVLTAATVTVNEISYIWTVTCNGPECFRR